MWPQMDSEAIRCEAMPPMQEREMGHQEMTIANQIAIDPEFSRLIPPLQPDELAQLESNILAEGCRDALVVWRGLLLDGHNRLRICEEHGLPYRTIEIDLPDREAAADWIDANQLGRRNLSPDNVSLLRGRRYERTKRQDGGHGDQRSGGQNVTPNKAVGLAKEYGVDERTIKRDGQDHGNRHAPLPGLLPRCGYLPLAGVVDVSAPGRAGKGLPA